jgi:hypothetical protein
MNKETREFILYLVLIIALLIMLHLSTEESLTIFHSINVIINYVMVIICFNKLLNNIKK